MLKTLHEKARLIFMIGLTVAILAIPAYAVINRIVGGLGNNAGYGTVTRGDSLHVVPTVLWPDSLWPHAYAMIETTTAKIDSAVKADSADLITHDRIMVWHFGDEDWGDMSVSTNSVTLDADVVGPDEMADGDHGDFTYATGVATLDAGVVGDNEIDYANVTLTDFVYQTAWRVFYSNADGDVTELILGGDGTYLRSNGAAAAPTFDTPPGGDPGTAIHDSLWTRDDFWDDLDLAPKQDIGSDIAILYPISNDSNSCFIRFTNVVTGDDKEAPVTWSKKIPLRVDANGVDSITYNMRTTGEAVASGVQVKVYKRDGDELGALVLCDSVAIAATTAGAWEHKSTGALDVASADAGDILEIQLIVTLDQGERAEIDKPRPYYTGR